jgi:2-oxoglutarate ferredoxin oxidoreductase subunit alpha
MTKESVDFNAFEDPGTVDRKPSAKGSDYLPFAVLDGEQVPAFEPIGGEILSRQTSSTHGANGYITGDPAEIAANVERLKDKLIREVDRFTYLEHTATAGAETLIVTYGITTRAAKVACRHLATAGKPTDLLALKTLWPVPADKIREIAAPYSRIVVVEMNLGQYVREIERILPGKPVSFRGQMNGKLITPGQIERAVQHG